MAFLEGRGEPYEVIVVDDGSRDATRDRVRELQALHDRISLRTDGDGFDVELLLLARRRGYTISEVAVNWADQPGSKVRALSDGPRMLGQTLLARAALARGLYGR